MADTMNDTMTDRGMQSSVLTVMNISMPTIELNRVYQGWTAIRFTSGSSLQEPFALSGQDYPELVALWDNDADAIYDTV
jgi:hypothetical protein